MPGERSPYMDTGVPITRSQDAIRKALAQAGALGVRFGTSFERLDGAGWHAREDAPPCICEFVWPVEGGTQVVRLQVVPLAPDAALRGSGWRVSPEQRERQAWRGLYWYLDGALKAATFGLIRFEDVFLSFIVSDAAEGPTVGEVLVPWLREGRAPALLLGQGEVLEGEVVE